jgi:L-asparaginase
VSRNKIVVLGTGGTIAGTAADAADNIGYRAAQLGVEQLVAGITAAAGCEVVTEQVAQLDSKDMDFATWRLLGLRCAHWLAQPQVLGVVVTHGTDTLEETAFFLHRLLGPSRPLVLTCAMRPASSAGSDGPQNLADALVVAATRGARGVLVVCAGAVHGAEHVAKVHPYRLDAFNSGEAGPLALVEEARVRNLWPWPAADGGDRAWLARLAAPPSRWPRIEVVMNHAGADGALVEALLALGVDGIVAAGTGNGTLAAGLQQALLAAQRRGVMVVRASRCAQGAVVRGPDDLLPDSQGLSAVKARVALLQSLT